MDQKQRLLLTFGIGMVLIASFYLITGVITKYTGYSVSPAISGDSEFRSCLEEKNIYLYINTKDHVSTLKSLDMNGHLDRIRIVNCFLDNEACLNRDIGSFPTWVIDGKSIEGEISVSELAEYSGCSLK